MAPILLCSFPCDPLCALWLRTNVETTEDAQDHRGGPIQFAGAAR